MSIAGRSVGDTIHLGLLQCGGIFQVVEIPFDTGVHTTRNYLIRFTKCIKKGTCESNQPLLSQVEIKPHMTNSNLPCQECFEKQPYYVCYK